MVSVTPDTPEAMERMGLEGITAEVVAHPQERELMEPMPPIGTVQMLQTNQTQAATVVMAGKYHKARALVKMELLQEVVAVAHTEMVISRTVATVQPAKSVLLLQWIHISMREHIHGPHQQEFMLSQ